MVFDGVFEMPNEWLPVAFIHTCPQCLDRIPIQYTASIFLQSVYCRRCQYISQRANIHVEPRPQSTQQFDEEADRPQISIPYKEPDYNADNLSELLTNYLSFETRPKNSTHAQDSKWAEVAISSLDSTNAQSLTLDRSSRPSSLSSSLDNPFSDQQCHTQHVPQPGSTPYDSSMQYVSTDPSHTSSAPTDVKSSTTEPGLSAAYHRSHLASHASVDRPLTVDFPLAGGNPAEELRPYATPNRDWGDARDRQMQIATDIDMDMG